MAKTETTKQLERLLENKFNKRDEFYVFECTIGWCGNEIVDCIMYNCDRQTHCYEIKQSVQDFHSKNALTFIGNKNYFVMPYALYKKVKEEIPVGIGVYVAIDRLEEKEREEINMYGIKKIYQWVEPVDGLEACKEINLDKEVLGMNKDLIKEKESIKRC